MVAYLPIGLFFVVAIIFAVLPLMIGPLVRPTPTPTEGKLAPYECGVEPSRDARQRFSIRFYIVAMLFIVFDIETIFFLPWAVIYRDLGLFGLVEMFIFIFVLAAGLAYAWKKGALEWD